MMLLSTVFYWKQDVVAKSVHKECIVEKRYVGLKCLDVWVECKTVVERKMNTKKIIKIKIFRQMCVDEWETFVKSIIFI